MQRLVFGILGYIFIVGVGFSLFAVFWHIFVALEKLPESATEFGQFQNTFSKGWLHFWLAGVFSGLFYFWIDSAMRNLFLLLPALFPLCFCVFFLLTH